MIKISKQQAHSRFKTLPQNIKDALFAESLSDSIEDLGEKYHLSQDRVSDLALLLGHIFLGFIYREDLQKELEQSLHFNHQMAIELAGVLTDKLLLPFKEDLDKIYRPLNESDFGLAPDRRSEERPPAASRPILLKEIPTPVVLEKGNEMPRPPRVSLPPVPPPKSPGVPMPNPSPVTFGKKDVVPLSPPSTFRLGGIPKPSYNSSVPQPPAPPKAARVEIGIKEPQKTAPLPEVKSVGREPVRYTEPKSVFMPSSPPKQPEKKLNVPIPSYPQPIPPQTK